MKTAVSAIGLGLALLAAGCGSSPKVAAPAPPDRLHLERAGDVLPAPGLHDALLVRPRDLAAEPEFLAAIERVFPKKERLGYVEAGLPDETLKISAVGAMVPGEYTESIVPAALWREWRPVFINVR